MSDRLISADELRKNVLYLPNCYNGFSDTYDKELIVDLIDEQPTVDAVEVVRCEDCEFSSMPKLDSDEVYCTKHSNWFKFNGYCHLGRKEDGNN